MKKLPAPRTDRISYIKHRQDVTKQIYLPVVFVAVMILLLAALIFISTFFGGGDVNRWASVAIIWMVIPLMFLLLVILTAAVGVVFLLTRVLEISPRYVGLVQSYGLLLNTKIILWTDKVIEPILKTRAWLSLFSKAKD